MVLSRSRFSEWLAQPLLDTDLKEELLEMADSPQKIEDAFGCELQFGTGGLRGILGAGTNRMNIHVVRRAAQATADVLNAAGLPRRAAIGYDSRIGSERFARETACVLAANGIETYLYPRLEPVPALSFAVRTLSCGVGICITASHNPAQYNGFKVYGPDGCQLTPEPRRSRKTCGHARTLTGLRRKALLRFSPQAGSAGSRTPFWTRLSTWSSPCVWAAARFRTSASSIRRSTAPAWSAWRSCSEDLASDG